MESAMQRIGFIGVGNMGSRMARRLHDAGYALTVCDREPAALRAFAKAGVTIASSPAACADNDCVILMVANDAQLKDVVLASDGLLAGIDAEASLLVAVMSTVLPETIAEIAATLSQKNVAVIDAPVSGGLAGAEAGTLTLMIGGAEDDIARIRPILQAMAATIFHCGALGSGQLTKIVNNMVGVSNLFLVAEAMTLAKRYGLAPERLVAIMEASSGRSTYTRDWEARKATYSAVAGDRDRLQAHLAVCRKDLRCALALASNARLPLGVLASIEAAIAAGADAEFQKMWQEAFG